MLLKKWAMPVLDSKTGQTLKYRQLRNHPTFHQVWNKSNSNELGRLYQGIGTNSEGTSKRVDSTDTFFVIDYDNIPADRNKASENRILTRFAL